MALGIFFTFVFFIFPIFEFCPEEANDVCDIDKCHLELIRAQPNAHHFIFSQIDHYVVRAFVSFNSFPFENNKKKKQNKKSCEASFFC